MFKRGISGSGNFMWYAQLDASGIFHVLICEWLFTWMFICYCCNLVMFYDWSECVMSVLGTTKHSSCNWHLAIKLYCLLAVSAEDICAKVEHLSILKRSPVLLLKKKKDAMGHEQTPGPGRLHRDLKHTGYMDAVLKAFQKVTTCMKCSRYTSHTVSRQTSHAVPIDQTVTLSR